MARQKQTASSAAARAAGPERRAVRVLLVDDDENEFLITRDLMALAAKSGAYQLDWSATYEDALSKIKAGRHDVYLIDYHLGARDGLDLLREAKRLGCKAPLIFLTGLGYYAVDVEAMKAGAADYLVKGKYDPELLERTIRYCLERTRAEERYKAILEGTQALVFQTDKAGRLIFVNEAAAGLLGETPDQLAGEPLLSIVSPADRTHVERALKEQADQGIATQSIEFRYCGRGNKKGWLIALIRLLTDREGAAGFGGVAQDITERKHLEEATIQSEKLGAMGQLAAGVSHELNNPLTTILGNVKTILEGLPDDHPWIHQLRAIDRAGDRCRELVRELLAFSRKEESQPQDFDLREPVAAALALVKVQAQYQSVEIGAALGRAPLPLRGFKNHLEQVVLNLCNNAIDAMPKGGRLRLELRRLERNGLSIAQLKVSDTGPGIPPDIRGRIFEPFFTTKPVGKGTGLGLSLVQSIVAKHGGEIEASSPPGSGAVFTVTLPLRRAP